MMVGRHTKSPHFLAIGLAASLTVACAGTVSPADNLDDPLPVYLLNHSPHTTLVLPGPDGGLIRYKYCDWRWCVEETRHFFSGAAALLWPTQSGLGRQFHPGLDTMDSVSDLAPEGAENVVTLKAERERIFELNAQLDAEIVSEEEKPLRTSTLNLDFQPHERPYWLGNQSNLMVAEWLRALGMEVRVWAFRTNWRIEGADPAGN